MSALDCTIAFVSLQVFIKGFMYCSVSIFLSSDNTFMQLIAEFLVTQFSFDKASIILSDNKFPYLQMADIAFFLIWSFSSPSLSNKILKNGIK